MLLLASSTRCCSLRWSETSCSPASAASRSKSSTPSRVARASAVCSSAKLRVKGSRLSWISGRRCRGCPAAAGAGWPGPGQLPACARRRSTGAAARGAASPAPRCRGCGRSAHRAARRCGAGGFRACRRPWTAGCALAVGPEDEQHVGRAQEHDGGDEEGEARPERHRISLAGRGRSSERAAQGSARAARGEEDQQRHVFFDLEEGVFAGGFDGRGSSRARRGVRCRRHECARAPR